jgi:hypothetical protein
MGEKVLPLIVWELKSDLKVTLEHHAKMQRLHSEMSLQEFKVAVEPSQHDPRHALYS